MKRVVILAALAMAACQTPAEPKIVTKVVNVPVSAKCVPKGFRDPPTYPDGDEQVRDAAGPGELLQLLAAGRLLRIQRLRETETVIAGCK